MNQKQRQIPLVIDFISHWGKLKPGKLALVQYESGQQLLYKQFTKSVRYYALRLLAQGIEPGDRIVAVSHMSPEMICLMCASMKVGAIFVPIDVNQKVNEILEDVEKATPNILLFSEKSLYFDLKRIGYFGSKNKAGLKAAWYFSFDQDEWFPGTTSFLGAMSKKGMTHLRLKERLLKKLLKIESALHPWQPVLMFFKRGINGERRPVLLCHENIITQFELIKEATGLNSYTKTLTNMGLNEPGAIIHGILLTLMAGGASVLMRSANPADSLYAIETYQINRIYQLPNVFLALRDHPGFLTRDFSCVNLGIVISSDPPSYDFFKRLSPMFPKLGGGVFLPETAGFISYLAHEEGKRMLSCHHGKLFPQVNPLSIREPLHWDGKTGIEKSHGSLGEICCHPPMVFLGYYGQEKITARTISKEGILYTGKKGFIQEQEDGLYLGLENVNQVVSDPLSIKQKLTSSN